VNITPNRVAAGLAAVGAVAAGLAPVVANMDWSSTAGVAAGILGAVAVVNKWLDGWQKHEARQAPVISTSGSPGVTWQFPAGASAVVADPTPEVKPTAARKRASGGRAS
jgi:drug/metabolite transporter (DMT)-like permease